MVNSFKLKDVAQYDIVFICGLYKTGTSLLTQLIETDLKFINPSSNSNPNERGYGQKKDRYHTRECKQLRFLNSEFINNPSKDDISIFKYFHALETPSVLKDPQFCFTLFRWYDKAFEMGFAPLIIFTSRELEDTKKSWLFAPYTKRLLENGKFDLFLSSYNKQIEIAKQRMFSYLTLQFNEILNLSIELNL